MVALLGYSPSPGLGAIRVLSAGIAGVSMGLVALRTMPTLPDILALLAAIAITAAALFAIQVLTDRWCSLYPNAARQFSRPRQWFRRVGSAPAGRSPATIDWEFSVPPTAGTEGANGSDEEYQETDRLTPADILNLDQHDIDMVRSISRMDDRDVLDIMVPRLDMDAVAITSSLDELVEQFVSTRHTRLPVYRNSMDDVVGIVHISDVLPALATGQSAVQLDDLMRTPEFVAENMAVDDLLHLMRSKSLQMAIVVDEYGGVEGLVTLEDVLEEIVGEIEDEFAAPDDPDAPTRVEDGSWIVNATTPVEDVNRMVGVELDGHDVNTIGGFVYTELGRMPTTGDVICNDGVQIEVLQVRGRRIQQLRLSLAPGDVLGEREADAAETRA
ncbi:MAG: hemolysin family protein [Chloroflexi bacterium]|nr:hemolysin family protein [Chloroflexota bacterium]